MTDTQREGGLAGKRVLVTGASRGIGREIAVAMAAAGADVAVSARREETLQEVAGEIRALGRRGPTIPCDVTQPVAVEGLARRVTETLGGIDILVNNAGAAGSHKFIDHPDELWHQMIDVNLNGVYYVCKAIVPQMVAQRWGRIINIASVAAKSGARYVAAYTASKHGVLGLTRALAAELVSDQITVNAICPGYVDTPMTEGTIANITAVSGMNAEEARKRLEKMNPQQRLIEPGEVAALALYLAQDVSKGINGQAINVDGGAVMW